MSGHAERPGGLDAAIGERVRHVRKAAGVTQEQLAGALGVTPTAVSYWENGKRSIAPSIMVRVARALSVEVAALLPESWVRSAWFLVPPSPSPVESEGEKVSVPLPEWEALKSEPGLIERYRNGWRATAEGVAAEDPQRTAALLNELVALVAAADRGASR